MLTLYSSALELVTIYFIVVETRYIPLEEVCKYFDGAETADVAEVANAEVDGHAEKIMTAATQLETVEA